MRGGGYQGLQFNRPRLPLPEGGNQGNVVARGAGQNFGQSATGGTQAEQWAANLECYKCGEMGHISRNCPQPPNKWLPFEEQQGRQKAWMQRRNTAGETAASTSIVYDTGESEGQRVQHGQPRGGAQRFGGSNAVTAHYGAGRKTPPLRNSAQPENYTDDEQRPKRNIIG
jgi:Zinc knuckle